MCSSKSFSGGFLVASSEKAKTEPSINTIAESKPTEKEVDGLDLDKLAHAVAFAETSSCTKGTAIKKKNCFGIMRFWIEKGVRKRTAKTYKSHEEGFEDFKRIWTNPKGWYKGRFPDEFLAAKWTGNDNAKRWLSNVTKYYNSH